MQLSIKQTQAIDFLEDDITTDLLFGGGAGGGKSALGCYWQIKRRLKYPGTRGLIGRAVLKTLKDTTLNTFFQIAAIQGLRPNYHFTYNGQRNVITFFNQSEILLKDLETYPSDPEFDELGSLEITDAFVDEYNQVTAKAGAIVRSRIRYKLDENGLIPKFMGSCNPAKNHVYLDYYKPLKDGTMPPYRKFIQSLLSDNPYISKHYRENLLKLDENSKQRLLYGNWEYDDDPTSLIPIQKIYAIFQTTCPDGVPYITVDVARFGSDTTTIIIWNGLNAIRVMRLIKKSTTWVSQQVKELKVEYKVHSDNIIADEDGVGGGVVDQLGCQGFVNNSRAIGADNFNNLKSQCYYKLAELVNKGQLSVRCEPDIRDLLVQELEQVKQFNMDKDTTKQVMPKDKVKELIGRSPDISDALMMRMFYEVMPKNERSFFVG